MSEVQTIRPWLMRSNDWIITPVQQRNARIAATHAPDVVKGIFKTYANLQQRKTGAELIPERRMLPLASARKLLQFTVAELAVYPITADEINAGVSYDERQQVKEACQFLQQVNTINIQAQKDNISQQDWRCGSQAVQARIDIGLFGLIRTIDTESVYFGRRNTDGTIAAVLAADLYRLYHNPSLVQRVHVRNFPAMKVGRLCMYDQGALQSDDFRKTNVLPATFAMHAPVQTHLVTAAKIVSVPSRYAVPTRN